MSQLTSLETLQDLNKKMEQLVALQQFGNSRKLPFKLTAYCIVEAVNPEDGKIQGRCWVSIRTKVSSICSWTIKLFPFIG